MTPPETPKKMASDSDARDQYIRALTDFQQMKIDHELMQRDQDEHNLAHVVYLENTIREMTEFLDGLGLMSEYQVYSMERKIRGD